MKYRILVVDDEPVNLSLLKTILEKDYSLAFARSGTEALERVYQNPPDLILLDIMMPEMSGFEVCEILQQSPHYRHIPVILVTALTDSRNEERGLSLGAVDYVTKPVAPALVRARVRTHLSLYHRQQELESLVSERTFELEQAQLAAIQMLSRAGEYKDNETGTHVIRMSYFSKVLAQTLGWTQREQQLIFQASPMHDIGKIGIPDAIIRKPGQLDREEWEAIKGHPEIGAQIIKSQFYDLSQSQLFKMAERIAISHHEKWDGSGYPKGLKGEDIPIEGRIVAIADVFDALTSQRPYKEAWPVDRAIELLKSESGKHFDPKLVDAFLLALPEIIEIREKWNDARLVVDQVPEPASEVALD